jgi:hypothetical protein
MSRGEAEPVAAVNGCDTKSTKHETKVMEENKSETLIAAHHVGEVRCI